MSKARNARFYTTINIISGLAVLVINICISFFLSPYIIRTIGVEANGFVTLAQNFVTYADLIVTALNAMAARFITIAYVKKDYKTANLYYNSVFWGNLFLVAVLLVPAAIIIAQLESFVDVPANILYDVKILFAFIFLSFFLRTGMPNWDCGTYVTNRVSRSYLANMFTALLRCVILVCMFSILNAHVWYVGLALFLTGFAYLMAQWYNTHSLTPELTISLKKPICSFNMIKVLVGSGIWSSIAIAGNALMSGVDLLICNLYLGATAMGVLSVSKSIPDILTTFAETIRGAFGPELTIAYAKGHKDDVLACIQRAIKISSVIVTIPTAGIIVMSGNLYKLWIPSQDAHLLQILTTLAIIRYIPCSGIASINNVFVTVNKVKYNSAALVITGLVSIGTTLGFIMFTDWDLFAVAGVSSIIMIIKDLCFMAPVSAKLLGFKWCQFYPYVGISILCSGLIIAVGMVVCMLIPINSWLMFFVSACIIGIIGLALNMMIVLNKEERAYFISMVKRKLHR